MELCEEHQQCSPEEIQGSEEIKATAESLFHEFGPLLWKRRGEQEQRPWLYAPGHVCCLRPSSSMTSANVAEQGWKYHCLYEQDRFYDNAEDYEL
jgi:hypothetical protein